jgi:hypothetical protein
MGQYQQWLHYREVDKQLQAQLETLERELAHLQGSAQSDQPPQDAISSETWPVEKPAFESTLLTKNKIIRALADSFNGQSAAPTIKHTGIPANKPTSNVRGETISSALFAWSNLPDFDAPEMPMEAQVTNSQQFNPDFEQALPRIPDQEMELLPDDMSSFINEHTLTDPQIELPWWLRNIAVNSRTNHSTRPIDHESMRTNRLVQRWLERWGHLPPPPNSRGEDNHE